MASVVEVKRLEVVFALLENPAAEQFHNCRAKAMKRNHPNPSNPYWIQDEHGVFQYIGVDEEQLDLSEIYIHNSSTPDVKVIEGKLHLWMHTWDSWYALSDALQSSTCKVKRLKRPTQNGRVLY
jgi:hypothetical protein